MSCTAILGANGQDGSYLCEIQAAAGHKVLAVGLQEDYSWESPPGDFSYHKLDISDQHALRHFLEEQRPEIIYHVAAVHGAAGFSYETVVGKLFSVSVISVHTCLEYLRHHGRGQLFYASSAKVFGASLAGTINENTARRPDCLYSVAKIAAANLIDCYRRDHSVSALVALLFNHESKRRPAQFFVPTVARALASGLAGEGAPEVLNSLDFYADWGSAREFMRLASDAMSREYSGEILIATGRTVYAAEAVELLFNRHGLDYRDWLVVESANDNSVSPFTADIGKLETIVGRTPAEGFPKLLEEMASVTAEAGANT